MISCIAIDDDLADKFFIGFMKDVDRLAEVFDDGIVQEDREGDRRLLASDFVLLGQRPVLGSWTGQ